MSTSLSRTPIRILIEGLGEARGEFVRVYAPLTVEVLLKRLPLDGVAHPMRGGISMIVGLRRGEEKPVSQVEAGTIAYWPMGDALCIFHSAASTHSPVNRVGRVTDNLEIMGGVVTRSRIRMERAEQGAVRGGRTD